MLEMSDLFILFGIVLVASYWWQAKGVKEIALAAAKRHCDAVDVQFLDEFVMTHRLWFKRNDEGRVAIWRSYIFEFCTNGDVRYNGQVVTLGRKVLSVTLEPHQYNE